MASSEHDSPKIVSWPQGRLPSCWSTHSSPYILYISSLTPDSIWVMDVGWLDEDLSHAACVAMEEQNFST